MSTVHAFSLSELQFHQQIIHNESCTAGYGSVPQRRFSVHQQSRTCPCRKSLPRAMAANEANEMQPATVTGSAVTPPDRLPGCIRRLSRRPGRVLSAALPSQHVTVAACFRLGRCWSRAGHGRLQRVRQRRIPRPTIAGEGLTSVSPVNAYKTSL